MTGKLRVFVSSVQKELEDERLIIQNLVSTDTFLSAYCVPMFYEFDFADVDPAESTETASADLALKTRVAH